jgi:predicted alpha/beta-hydrolase family hydrolase
VSERRLTIETPKGPVSAAFTGKQGEPLLVLAHGAGNDMDAPLLVAFAEGLAAAGVACVRFNFLYKEQGRRAPDREPALRDAWGAAFEEGQRRGGPVCLVFVGYPLHPPGKPERARDGHLDDIDVPMLFLQGTADPFARWELLKATVERVGARATLHPVEGGDHSFRARGRPRDDEGTGSALGEAAARFILEHR